MNIKELRSYTGLSQSKFANMFEVPLSTLKDWEQGRRKPPVYVVNMMKSILELRGIITSKSFIISSENRRKSVQRATAIIMTATKGPDEVFLEALENYINGEITLEELETNVDNLKYIEA